MNSRLILAFTLLTALLLAPHRASALPGDLSSLFPVNDDNPTASLPSEEDKLKHPLEFGYFLQDLIARAEGAFLKKDWANAVKYYEALARAVPDRAVSFSRLCVAYAELGKMDLAAANCRAAIGRGGAQVIDHFRYINFSLRNPRLEPRDVADIDASIAHLREFAATQEAPAADSASSAASSPPVPSAAPVASSAKPGTPPAPSSFAAARGAAFAAARAEASHRKQAGQEGTPAAPEQAAIRSLPLEIEVAACKLAVYLKDGKRLAACLQALKGLNADPKVIVPFEWSQALVANDRKRASALLEQAKALQLPDTALRSMEAEQDRLLKPTGIVGFLTRGASGRITAVIVTLLTLGGGLWWFLASLRRRKVPPEAQAS